MVGSLSNLKAAIASSRREDRWARDFLGKPNIKFILARNFNRYSRLLAYDFTTEFYELSGIEILDAYVKDGCIDVNLRLSTHLDFAGRDVRTMVISSRDYHELFSAFDVKSIYLHCFPNTSNFDSYLLIGDNGRPFRND